MDYYLKDWSDSAGGASQHYFDESGECTPDTDWSQLRMGGECVDKYYSHKNIKDQVYRRACMYKCINSKDSSETSQDCNINCRKNFNNQISAANNNRRYNSVLTCGPDIVKNVWSKTPADFVGDNGCPSMGKATGYEDCNYYCSDYTNKYNIPVDYDLDEYHTAGIV